MSGIALGHSNFSILLYNLGGKRLSVAVLMGRILACKYKPLSVSLLRGKCMTHS